MFTQIDELQKCSKEEAKGTTTLVQVTGVELPKFSKSNAVHTSNL